MTLSPAVSTILQSLQPGFWMPHSEHATPDQHRSCPYCGVMVWEVANRNGQPLLLNEQPSAWGRWVMDEPGLATFCPGLRMIDWPLPRYTSHLIDCVELIRKREEQREERAQEMRWNKQQRKLNSETRQERSKAYFGRFEG